MSVTPNKSEGRMCPACGVNHTKVCDEMMLMHKTILDLQDVFSPIPASWRGLQQFEAVDMGMKARMENDKVRSILREYNNKRGDL